MSWRTWNLHPIRHANCLEITSSGYAYVETRIKIALCTIRGEQTVTCHHTTHTHTHYTQRRHGNVLLFQNNKIEQNNYINFHRLSSVGIVVVVAATNFFFHLYFVKCSFIRAHTVIYLTECRLVCIFEKALIWYAKRFCGMLAIVTLSTCHFIISHADFQSV